MDAGFIRYDDGDFGGGVICLSPMFWAEFRLG